MDSSQIQPAATAEDSSQPMAPVTAAGSTPVDNATHQQPVNTQQASPQDVGGGPAVAVVDEEPKDDFGLAELDAEEAAFLAATPAADASQGMLKQASAADLAAQGLAPDVVQQQAPAPTPPPPVVPSVPVTATAPVPEDDLEPGQGKRPRFNNVRTVDSVDVQALAAYKAAQKTGTLGGKTMVQFMTEFAGPKGQPSAPVTTPATADVTPVDITREPTTVAEVDAQLRALRDERYRVLNDTFDFAAAAKIEEQEEALRSKREGIREGEQAAQTAAEQADVKALSTVAEWFPQATNPADPLVAKCNEIVAGWEATGNPLLSTPNRCLIAYTEAAAALNIKPASIQPTQAAPSPVPSPSTTAPVNRPPMSAILASGGARDIPRAPVSDDLDTLDQEEQAYLASTVSMARRAA